MTSTEEMTLSKQTATRLQLSAHGYDRMSGQVRMTVSGQVRMTVSGQVRMTECQDKLE